MDIQKVLEQYRRGEIDLAEAEDAVRSMGFLSVSDIARVDTFRCKRTGVPEAVLAEGKTDDDLLAIVRAQVDAVGRVLVTRVSSAQMVLLESAFPNCVQKSRAQTICVVHAADRSEPPKGGGVVAIISAGTVDIKVAEETKMTAEEMGCQTIEIYDVGVAGYHRLILEMENLREAKPDAVVVAAGREGTLPTVVAGIIDVPVIGLPVSSGYGMGANGEAALLSMLQSCSVISVVNIDAGFVAGAYAARIANRMQAARSGDKHGGQYSNHSNHNNHSGNHKNYNTHNNRNEKSDEKHRTNHGGNHQ
ncbi:Pyridinium-3,5-biscarboxylic acid mononucleotide synthase [Methanimicrococcus sp. At1]|uniref:Pyridinium-3,5-biscarboxylic acid mononucleotide synthase n=1 Tax=Methanimicrococcus hacksteinii TaxID=3028293 RepID=A0ABU3VQK4_9EURY|nr:nickel pincer cofactor biosynthesis protein LarB [Methanimicrococcus sp. At1]MDV0445687.1 Pyridinium-3,5-biscarboxylic acid mononucleotide synthase [Methanimicrococcus sp. At1]